MHATIALFDIDGTLIQAGGAGRRAVELAISDALGRAVTCESIEFAGRTDPWIVREALVRYGVSPEEGLIGEVLSRYVVHLPKQLERASAFAVLPGAQTLLEALVHREDVILGLGTGNTEKAAYAKLARGRLDSFFTFGGFGSDHSQRAELVRVGLQRGRRKAGSGRQVRAVVIGDTPHDVAAAHANGADCVAVATGGYDESALRAAGAGVVVSHLAAREVLDVLG